MNANEFARRRARIEAAHGRGRGYTRRAMAALVRQAGATQVIIRGRHVAWRLPNGQTVCRKRRFTTERDAADALRYIQMDPKTPRIPTRHYLCPHCSGWHHSSHPVQPSDAQ